MKRFRTAVLLLSAVLTMVLVALPAMAAKPIDVISLSNGFPSGQHFNLNLHGRDPATYTGTPDGNAIIVDIAGDSTIQYLSNQKNMNNTELAVLDSLAEAFGPQYDPAQVYLPYNIVDEADNVTKPAGGYYVYGRILGTPNNGSEGPSTLRLTQNFVVAAANSANSTTDPWPFGFDPNLDEIGLGVITTQGNLYLPSIDGTFKRFEPTATTAKGKSKAVDITELFKWTGYVTDNTSLDSNLNGYLDIGDVPLTFDTNGTPGIQQGEFLAWLAYLASIGEATYYNGAWIFDIADMVISGQTVINDGTKNFQIRFYPVVTTVFGDARK